MISCSDAFGHCWAAGMRDWAKTPSTKGHGHTNMIGQLFVRAQYGGHLHDEIGGPTRRASRSTYTLLANESRRPFRFSQTLLPARSSNSFWRGFDFRRIILPVEHCNGSLKCEGIRLYRMQRKAERIFRQHNMKSMKFSVHCQLVVFCNLNTRMLLFAPALPRIAIKCIIQIF